MNASFRAYPGIGHATDRMIHKDVMMFFRAVMAVGVSDMSSTPYPELDVDG